MIWESLGMFFRKMKGVRGLPKHKGSPDEICREILRKCYNGRYFQASAGHFSLFYIRDFGICIEALLRLGYRKEVENTLKYALSCYERYEKITTTIKKNGVCKDFFNIAPDSLAFLLFSLRVSKADALVSEYRQFLEKEIARYYEAIVDKNTGLVKKGYFSSIKDNAIRNSSCYDNCMLAMIRRNAGLLKLNNPFAKYNYPKLIYEHFWNKKEGYFKDDLDLDIPTGDANVFPYWCGIFKDRNMIKSSINAIQKNHLDKPFPLRYWKDKKAGSFLFIQSLLAPNYEGNTCWVHLGLCYMDVLAHLNDKQYKSLLKEHIRQYTNMIIEHKNFLEVYTIKSDGQAVPYRSLFYHCDDSMIWCSKYLAFRP